ncbi:MAG TPA: indole-3-glycerol-phosphate synthase [bacterium]|uniref:indole-3-glycerol-phosphate synthase n=1 Tax=candidate division TA06 bacterium ADurb.Bin131 TaxID=1852827 RepID=A0A1V6CBU0_UNCT6|nr:MAG: Indole-3-glycerol phosphate synthase [candidate division TA06 bacterium ADurb.Bin131]HOQ82029.1 indole-3-glycerol-phosphate synthase [bacterium]HPC29708.1 indole-3-glycerol-phosphate synthase [bacterium]HRV04189.1 indole-3-glycerol-phosphate synthase [Candidatus Ratteibacteria bacterium]
MLLNRILENKKISINKKKQILPVSCLKIPSAEKPNSIIKKISHQKFIIIAETKKASPSGGVFRKKYNPARIATSYVSGGASAVSVLTEEAFFLGSIEDLRKVKNAVDIPVLNKDFIIDEYQIYLAKYFGADCVLLILRILSDSQFLHMFELARSLNLEVLIEVHNKKEIQRLSNILPDSRGALIGINSRDIDTLSISHETIFNLLSSAKNIKIPVIAESGVKDANILRQLYQSGASGALIGEYFLRSKSPGELVKKLLKEMNYG